MAKKLPSFQFYPGDHLKEPSLRRCSKAAKGVWWDMVCISFECEERGVFQTSGVPWPDEDIAAAVGGDIAENLRAIGELLAKGVCSRNQAGAVFCRRVVRDERKRRLCGEAGKRGGGNPALCDRTNKGTVKGASKGTLIGSPKQNPKASSSSSDEEGAQPPSSSTSASASPSTSSAVSTADQPPEAASPSETGESASADSRAIAETGGSDSSISDAILAVFAHYRGYHPKRHLRPTSSSKEWKHIRARLKEGYAVEDLCEAIDGMMRNPFNQGENDQGTVYDSLELVVRNSTQVERYKAIPKGAPVVSQTAKFTHRAGQSYLQRRFPSQEELEHDAPY